MPEEKPAADTSVAPVDQGAGEGDGFIPDNSESKAAPEGEAKDKSDADAEKEEADDFLAEKTEDKASDKKADAPSDAKKDGESEAYQPFTLPEGMTLDDGALAKATPILRDVVGPDQDKAQKLVSLYADLAKETVETFHDQLAQAHRDNVKAWTEATIAHPEFGGDKLPESKAAAARAINALGSPELRKTLVEYNLDRHPEIFAFLARVGTKLSEDSLVREDSTAPSKAPARRVADIMYESTGANQ